jgi:hypothetical protein
MNPAMQDISMPQAGSENFMKALSKYKPENTGIGLSGDGASHLRFFSDETTNVFFQRVAPD